MVALKFNPDLTRPEGDAFRDCMNKSHQGMAHFAGTGPHGKRCRDCAYWQRPTADHIKPSTCAKFRSLMNAAGKKVPADASACKYFEGRQ